MASDLETMPRRAGFPAWIQEHVQYSDGRDPLGFDTISTDRILPLLLPGILANSRRARYLSLDLLLLDEFHRRGLGSTQSALGHFIRRAEFEYGCAVELCTRPNCGSQAVAMIGERAVSQEISKAPDAVERRYSIAANTSGGYGQLGYKSVLLSTGCVASQGDIVAGARLSFDRLVSDRGRAVAQRLRQRLEGTAYWAHLGGDEPVPIGALRELSDASCLCRLDESPDERDAIVSILCDPSSDSAQERSEALQRQRALALVLLSIEANPQAAAEPSQLRRTIWDLEQREKGAKLEGTVSGWAALVAKEYLAAAITGCWHAANVVGRTGPVDGWITRDFEAALRGSVEATPSVLGVPLAGADENTGSYQLRVTEATASEHLEDLLPRIRGEGTLAASIAALLLLRGRVPVTPAAEWLRVSGQDGWAQRGLTSALGRLDAHLASNPTLGDTAVWVFRDFVLQTHQRLATAKLGQYDPPFHTFRFRRERGRLRFFRRPDISGGWVAAPRFSALQSLCEDLGWWSRDPEGGTLTARGRAFLEGTN